jgi:hypothetical protein
VAAYGTVVTTALGAGLGHLGSPLSRDQEHPALQASSHWPARPHGMAQTTAKFGPGWPTCLSSGTAANDAKRWMPHVNANNQGGYQYYNPYIAEPTQYIDDTMDAVGTRKSHTYYGMYGYNCRAIAGTNSPSLHSFGAAFDTNTARNPVNQTHWDGKGSDGADHGTYVPDKYKDANFYWGLAFDDPHHFQYATGV